MQVTLTTISRKDKTSSAGKPYVSLGIKTQEHGGRWLSGFGRKDNKDWKAGDKVEIIVEEKGQYLNFSMPDNKLPAGYQLANNEIQKELTLIKDMLGRIISILQPIKKDNYPVMDETNNGEPPF